MTAWPYTKKKKKLAKPDEISQPNAKRKKASRRRKHTRHAYKESINMQNRAIFICIQPKDKGVYANNT